MMEQLVKPNDPILLRSADLIPIEQIKSEETRGYIERLLDASYDRREEREKPTVVGLAAPQIGISIRIIAVDVGADGKGGLSDLRVFVNPEITWHSKKQEDWYEGCWSTDRVCGLVTRPRSIRVRAYTPDGKLVHEKYSGYVARIFQHEIDHLDGQEFVAHITDDSKLHWVEDDEFKDYRNNQAWRHWAKKCPRERWNSIKGITN